MILWAVMTIMVAVAASALTIPLVRRQEGHPQISAIDVLKKQLAELDERVAARAISHTEADALRIEIKRRILHENWQDKSPAKPIHEKSRLWLAVGSALVVAVAATGLYTMFGRPDLPSAPIRDEDTLPKRAANLQDARDLRTLVGELEAKVKRHPSDPEGWRLLGWSYSQMGRPSESATAYARAAALDSKNSDYLSAEGEALTQAAGGQISPAAREAFMRAIALDSRDARARYFLAAWKDQQGDHTGAIADWLALLKSAPANAPWVSQVRGVIERTARENDVDIAGKLPPMTLHPPVADRLGEANLLNLRTDQIAALSRMSEADRHAMERDMVEQLAARLKRSPHDRAGWVRLMHARMALGEKTSAASTYGDARKAFAGQPAEIAALRAAARDLHVPGA